jgi:F-type H+-transporting ATPase subunit b
VEALGINLPGLVAQIVNFGILLFLLWRFALPPLLRMLDERAQRVRESMERAEALQRQSQQTEVEVRERLQAAQREAQAIVTQATQAGQRLQEEARAEANRQAAATVARAQEEIRAERDSAIAALRQEFAGLTIRAAERVIQRELDPNAHRQLIEEVLEQSGPAMRS